MSQKRNVITEADHVLGSSDAPVIMIEYGDYQCEFCIAAEPVIRKIRRHFDSKMTYVFRNFPLTGMHPKAFGMACLAESSKNERTFWQLHNMMLAGKAPTAADMKKAMKNTAAQKKVDADIQSGIHMGVNGTPTFFVNGTRYDGEHEFYAMQEFIQKKLLTKRTKNNMQKTGILKAGKTAPHFTLPSSDGSRISLKTFYGKPIVLVFYPADWSGVCGSQLALYNEILPEFKKYGAQILAISVDAQNSHMEFAKQRGFKFPLLSDFEPKGAVAKKYGAYHSKGGVTQRALFVIDPDGRIAWSYHSPMGVNPGADGILKALATIEKAKGKRS